MSHFSSAVSQMPPVPVGICYLKEKTLSLAQAFCRLPHVPECIEGDGKDPTKFECYMRCGAMHEEGQKLFNCTEFEMECYDGVTCVLPSKRMEDEEDGY